MVNNPTIETPKRRAILVGSGSCLPDKKLTNQDLMNIVETNDEWIITRTGIRTRRIASDGETTATLAAEAARRAIKDAHMDASEIELIILGTITPEMVFPSTACFVQDMIGAKNAWAFDLSAACSGFVYGLSIAQQFVSSGRYQNAIVIGAETLSRITNYEDRGS
jgi:3-oxoacyl-[acyl-carrier-protein] synthase-3